MRKDESETRVPGFVGIFGRDADEGQNAAALAQMMHCMQRDDIYESGTYVNEELGVWTGWAWHKGVAHETHQTWNGQQDVCLIMVGEEFTPVSEVSAVASGSPRNRGPNEKGAALLDLYERLGPDFLRSLNGSFSGVLVDLKRRRSMVFNDRFGLLRLHYYVAGGVAYVASEAKALLKVRPELRTLDQRSLGEFLSLGCVLQGRTLFKGVQLLAGGSRWIFHPNGEHVRDAYFDRAEWEQLEPLPPHSYYEELKDTWARVLPRYLQGPRTVGMSMTGGVDSRMILAWTQCPPGKLPCYTFSGRYRECADVRVAREVARLCRQPHTVLTVADEFLKEFPRLAEDAVLISDGAMDVSGSVDVYIQRLARQVAPVRLSGVNGGELLRGIVAFGPRPLNRRLFAPEVIRLGELAAETYADELDGNRASFVSFKQAPWFMSAKSSIEHSELVFRTPYYDNELVKLSYRIPLELRTSVRRPYASSGKGMQSCTRLALTVDWHQVGFGWRRGRETFSRSSCLRRSTRSIPVCRNGWRQSIAPCRQCD